MTWNKTIVLLTNYSTAQYSFKLEMLNIESNPKAWFTCGDILGIFQKSVCWVIITSNLKEINNIISEKKKGSKVTQ